MKIEYQQYVGQKHNHLTILDYIYDEKYHKHQFECKCDCGNECVKSAYHVINNKIKKCGFLDCKYKQYIGRKFNHLTILEYFYDNDEKYHKHKFKCKCDCGNECIRYAHRIINNQIKTCGFLDCKFSYNSKQKLKQINKYKQYIGQKFNYLTILEHFYDENTNQKYHKYKFKCKCDCGNECIKSSSAIINNEVISCGFLDCNFNNIKKIEAIEKYKLMIGQRFNKLIIIDFIYNEKEIDQYYRYQFKCKCDCGNNEYYTSVNQLLCRTPYGCNKCYIPSVAEETFSNWLNSLILNYTKGKYIHSDSNIQNYIEIDFLVENKLGIELHGLDTHATVTGQHDYGHFIGQKPKEYHINKLNSAVNNNIELLQFWNIEWNKKQDICKSIILNKLNQSKYREYARKFIVKEINKQIYDEFMNNHHIQGTTRNEQIRLGLFYSKNNNLISVMSFGSSRYSNDIEWEMFRFATYKNTQVVGGASKLFKYFIKNYDPKSIVSYSDRRIFNNGKLYETLGFEFSHNSIPSYWYFKNNSHYQHQKLHHRSNFMKHMLKNKLKLFDPELTEWENMEQNGYLRIYDCGNKVYVWKKE